MVPIPNPADYELTFADYELTFADHVLTFADHELKFVDHVMTFEYFQEYSLISYSNPRLNSCLCCLCFMIQI